MYKKYVNGFMKIFQYFTTNIFKNYHIPITIYKSNILLIYYKKYANALVRINCTYSHYINNDSA